MSNQIFNADVLQYAHLKVPKGCLTEYSTAYGWREFKNIMEDEDSEVPEPEKEIVYVEVEKIVYVDREVIKEVPVEVIKEVEKIVEKEVIKEVPVEVIKEVEKIVEVEKLIEVHDTIYVYDDTSSDIKLPSGETITLYIKEGVVHIKNIPYLTMITIYSVDGELVEARRAKVDDVAFELPRNELYVIKVGEKTFKVKI